MTIICGDCNQAITKGTLLEHIDNKHKRLIIKRKK